MFGSLTLVVLSNLILLTQLFLLPLSFLSGFSFQMIIGMLLRTPEDAIIKVRWPIDILTTYTGLICPLSGL
jgi:hypothetical protein